MASISSTLNASPFFSKKLLAASRLIADFTNGRSRATISRMRFSIAGKSSGVNGVARKKS